MPEQPKFSAAKFEPAALTKATFEPPEPDPLDDIAYTGDPEADSATELTAIKSAFQQRAEAESKRREKATDSEYWLCLCFQTRAQAEAFTLAVTGHPEDKYADGVAVARKLNIEIPPDNTPFGNVKIDRTLANLSRPLPTT